MEKVIGILGGLGPEATVFIFQKILQHTPASKDQEHLRILIDNNPKIPERLPAILGSGPDPVPMMVSSGQALTRAGAEFIIIPCVSAHYFLPELRRKITLPILSMLDEAAHRDSGLAAGHSDGRAPGGRRHHEGRACSRSGFPRQGFKQ